MRYNYSHLLITVVTASAPVFYLMGYYLGAEAIRAQAIKAGVAEYRIDNKTGDMKFVYITKNIEKLEK